jgi:hypothetical protein
MPNEWTKQRVQWLRQIAADPMVPDWGYKVAFLVAGCVNGQTLEAHPNPGKLAQRFGSHRTRPSQLRPGQRKWSLDRRRATMEEAFRLLVERGHLEERFDDDKPSHRDPCYAVIIRPAAQPPRSAP